MKTIVHGPKIVLIILFVMLGLFVSLVLTYAEATDYYVADPKGIDGIAGIADDVNSSDNYAGTEARPFATLAKGVAVAVAGDTVFIRGGVYNHPLDLLNSGTSGTPGNPITFQVYPGETATIQQITGEAPGHGYGIYVRNKSYITIAGLTVTDVGGWALIDGESDHIIIRDCHFSYARYPGNNSGICLTHSDYNIISNNTLAGGCDHIVLNHADRNLIVGNTVTEALHSLFAILASNFNVVRGNYFYNELDKIGEVYDAYRIEPITKDDTKHNLFEGNMFAYTPPAGTTPVLSGIQYAAQEGIIRSNLFYNTAGPGIYMTVWSGEGEYNTHNRIYNNVFNHSDFAGVEIDWQPYYHLEDNIIKNNSFTNSVFVPYDTRFVWYTQVLAGQPVQFQPGQLTGFVFENNNLYGAEGNPLWVIAYGRRDLTNPAPRSIATWQADYPEVFKANLQAAPSYVDPASYDFHLNTGSPMIDAGAFLTKTVGNGSEMTTLPVADVRYFFDGYDMTDENGLPIPGDLVQLEGDTKTARVIDIDYVNNTLTLDQPLSWTDGQAVSLAYNGSAPDIGAYEYILYGDVNGVGGVDANDASLTAMAAVGLITLNGEQIRKADVNKIGGPDANDASLIAQYAVGLIREF